MAISPNEQKVLDRAARILKREIKGQGPVFNSPDMTRDLLRVRYEHEEQEIFFVLFLDNRHRLIELVDLFFGTINAASVYPREVVKAVLKYNAASIICGHNHPSGIAEPSQADIMLTKRLKESLALIDVQVLDHIVVGSPEIVSFAERGLI